MKEKQETNKARKAMLAKVHIGKKELCLDDGTYRIILQDMFGVESAAKLSVRELEQLVRRFESKGWRSKTKSDGLVGPDKSDAKKLQADALKERIGQEVLNSDLTELRLRGLVRKICGVDDLQWCGDAVRLKKLLAVIGSMLDRGDIKILPTTTDRQPPTDAKGEWR